MTSATFEDIDADGNGQLTQDEFLDWQVTAAARAGPGGSPGSIAGGGGLMIPGVTTSSTDDGAYASGGTGSTPAETAKDDAGAYTIRRPDTMPNVYAETMFPASRGVVKVTDTSAHFSI